MKLVATFVLLFPAALPAQHSSVLEAQKLYDARKYAEAEHLCRAALADLAAAGKSETLDATEYLNVLARSITLAGRPPEALPIAQQSVAIAEKLFPPDDIRRTGSLRTLVFVYKWTGEYAATRLLLASIFSLETRTLGPEHPNAIATLDDIAGTQFSLGSYTEAVASFERLLSLRKKTPGLKSHEAAQALTGLGMSHWKLGRWPRAKSLLERALAIRMELSGERGVYVAANLHNLGIILGDMGDLRGQLALEIRAMRIREKEWGPDHPNTANGIHTVGLIQLRAGNGAAARENLRKAEAIRRKALGPAHRDTGQSLYALAGTYLADDPSRAVALALDADTILNAWLRANIRSLSEREALAFARDARQGLFVAIDAITRPSAGEAARRQVWDSVVRNRSMVLDETVWRRKLPNQDRLAGLRTAYSRHLLGGPQKEGASLIAYSQRLDQLRQDVESAERDLAARNAPFRQSLEEGRAGFEQVVAALPERAALVSFLRYQRHIFTAERSHYGAFVISADRRQTVFVDLGPAGEVDRLIAVWRDRFAQEAQAPGRSPKLMENANRAAGAALRKRLWDPLAPSLAAAARVFLVPDGPLHLVNFGALPSPGERYLMETAPLLHYLNTERDLVRPAPDQSAPDSLLVLGNPDFDRTAADPARRQPPRAASRTFRGVPASCFDPNTLRFDPLPSSRAEAEQVLQTWTQAGGRGKLITGSQATEAEFRSNAPGNRILHLATHGFFYQSRCGVNGPETTPLAVSGLALAGANRHASGAENGLLTADEISVMPLDNTEWAVLSGCETGLGRIETGEGVFGLRRAFQLAGARTIVMSLWPVQDETARRWMTALYGNRLQGRMQTAEAVRAASLAVLSRQRREGRSTHPLYWAPFVAAGDWR